MEEVASATTPCRRKRAQPSALQAKLHGTGRTPHLLTGTTAAVVGRLSRHTNGLERGVWRRRGQALGYTYGERAVSAGKWQTIAGATNPIRRKSGQPRAATAITCAGQVQQQRHETSGTVTCSTALPALLNTGRPGTPPGWMLTLTAGSTIPCASRG